MTGLRVTLAVVGVAGLVAAGAIGRPRVLLPLAVLGVVAFVVATGCLAADLVPLRGRHAACSALSVADAIVLALGGQVARLLEVVPAVVLVVLQAVPAVTSKRPPPGGDM